MLAYRLFQGFVFILYLFPYGWRKRFFIALARLAYRFDRQRRRVIRQNLAFAFGDMMSEERIETISRACFDNLALNMMQIVENHHSTPGQIAEKITYENLELVEKVIAQGRPIVFSSAHFGLWELGAVALSSQLRPAMIVYKKIKNPHFQEYLIASRGHLGMTSVNTRGAVKAMVKRMREKGAIAIMSDINTSRKDGVAVDFFGHPTLHPRTPAYLAAKFGAVIIPAFFHTYDGEHHIIRFHEPIESPNSGDEEADILEMTQRQAAYVETAVREQPELWFWCHRRWRTDYPEIYRR